MRNNHYDLGLLILRVGFSALMLTHGWGKFQMLIEGKGAEFPEVLGMPGMLSLILAVIGEFIAPILIILGIKTKISSLFPIVTMAVAAFVIHGSDPFGKKEFPLLYLIGFLAIFLMGGGKFSIDGRRG